MNTPTRPVVTAGAFGLAIGVIAVWLIKEIGSVDMPGEVAAAIGTVCTVVVQRFPRLFGS